MEQAIITNPQVAAGIKHSLVIDEFGNLWAWGDNEHGQLGDGDYSGKFIPQRIGLGIKFKSISTGLYHSLAIDSTGQLWAWGNN